MMNDEKGLSLASIDDVTRLATIAVKSKLTKLGMVEEAAVILMTGRELGLAPMQSLRGIYVVDGKPTLSSDMMVAVIRKSGQCETWRVVESTAERCTITTRRKGENADATRTWTRADADRAGVTHKDPWRKYPAAMLRHRCAADLARQEYPDVLLGLYDPDEMDASPAVVESVPTLEAIGIERSIGTRPTLPAPALPAPARWAVELTECVSLHDVRGLYATHSRYAYEDATARNRAMVDDVRAWLSERGVPGVTGAEASAILSTLPEAALRALSELWCDEEHPVSDRCVTAARAIHRAEWDEHSRRTAHTVVVRCYAHATGHTALNAAGAALVASRDADATPAQPEAPADDVPADVLAKIAAKGSVREILNSVGAHAAEVLTSPALAKAYAARLCTFDVAGDPRTDAQRMEDELGRVMKKAREKAAAQG
jgi:hypothetical protein